MSYGTSWPYRNMQEVWGPCHPGDLVFVAGYTANGKTLAMMNLAWEWAKDPNISVSYHTTEDADWLPYWFAGLEMNYTRMKLRSDVESKERAAQFLLNRWPKNLEVGGLPRNADAGLGKLAETGADVRFVDYIGGLDYSEYRDDRVGLMHAVSAANDVAEKQECVVVVGAQLALKRGETTKLWLRPDVDDLQGSSKLGHDAQLVLGTRRILANTEAAHADFLEVTKRRKPASALHGHTRGLELCELKSRHGSRPGRALFGFQHPTHLDYPSERFRILEESALNF